MSLSQCHDERRIFDDCIEGVSDPDAGKQLDPGDPSGTRLSVTDPDAGKQLDPGDPSGTRLTSAKRVTEQTEVRRVVRLPVREVCYSGFIIVRLTEKVALRDEGFPRLCKKEVPEDPSEDSRPPHDRRSPEPEPCRPEPCEPEPCRKDPELECLKKLLRECPPTELVQALTPPAIRLVEQIAALTPLPPLHSLAAYWRLDARHLPERLVIAVVRLLNELTEVDLAYRELAAFDPQGRFEDQQQHLRRAPLGIDAAAVTALTNAANVALVDLEQGWFNHQDLRPVNVIYGANREGKGGYRGNHGTAVLGELVANGDVLGVVPGATALQVSHYKERIRSGGQWIESKANGHVADGVMAAILQLVFGLAPQTVRPIDEQRIREARDERKSGDVLLIEVQRSHLPAEVDHADFDALRLASALGLIVVEAAGNGDFDLDRYRDENRRRILNRRAPGYRESGAVLVGAAESALPHNRIATSNYGLRVDCFALGDGVVTCGYGDLASGPRRASYTQSFSGTSAAAPIVAGAAALVQGLHDQVAGVRLAPGEMREILSNPATGTPQGADERGGIGVMPDLRAIVRELGLVPVLFSPVDAGGASARPFSAPSPIITVRSPIHVELTNRGHGNPNVELHLHWSELSTLVTPDMWKELVVNPLPRKTVRAGGKPVKFAPILPPSRLPRSERMLPPGHYSYLALPTPTGEPPPPLPPASPYFDWQAFVAFQRQYRGQLTIVRPPGRPADFPFLMTGASDSSRVFQFELDRHLPAAASLFLELPQSLATIIRRERRWPWAPSRFLGQPVIRFTLPARPRIRLPPLRLAAAGNWPDPAQRGLGRYPCRLLVRRAGADYSVSIRQLFEGEEVGQVSWKL